jgi:hypothetical protein
MGGPVGPPGGHALALTQRGRTGDSRSTQ